MAKKKFSNAQLVIGAIAVVGIGYLIFKKPTQAAVTSGKGNGTSGGTEGTGGVQDPWTYTVLPMNPTTWFATIFDSSGNSETLPPQSSEVAADGAARGAIIQYGGTPVRV